MLRAIVAVVLMMGLSGCFTPSRIIEADQWIATQRQERLVLTERVSYLSTWDTGLKVTEGAIPGHYKAEREDSEGLYFIGEGKPIWFSLPARKGEVTFVRRGGIYVPHDPAVPPHFVFVVETTEPLDGSIDDYIVQQSVQSVASPTNNFGAGANMVGNAVAFALISAIVSFNDGKYARLFPITDAKAAEKIRSAIRKFP